jgi:hypothetical protein
MPSIDIGGAAIDRLSDKGPNWTTISKENPANKAGELLFVEVFAANTVGGLLVGTFYGSGTTWTCRDYAVIGAAPPGWSRHEVSILVGVGDLIGFYCSAGSLDSYNEGGPGWLSKSGNHFVIGTPYTYSNPCTACGLSLYGERPLVIGSGASFSGRRQFLMSCGGRG